MPTTTVDRYGLIPVRYVVENRGVTIELFSKLIEIGDMNFGTVLNGSRFRIDLPKQSADESSFARSIGADDTDPVSSHDFY